MFFEECSEMQQKSDVTDLQQIFIYYLSSAAAAAAAEQYMRVHSKIIIISYE